MSNPSLLPPSRTDTEAAYEAITTRLEAIPVPIPTLWNPKTCPVAHLPWLAWTMGLDAWQPYWSEAIKRRQIEIAVEFARKKGTVMAVRNVVESFGGGLTLREWWQTEPKGTPHTFDVVLTIDDAGESGADLQRDVIASITEVKPVRSHFTFTIGQTAAAAVALFGAGRPYIYRRIQTVEA